MKVQELLENEQPRIDFKDYDEYVQWFESQDAMHVDSMEGQDGGEYDVLVVPGRFTQQKADMGADNPDDYYGYEDIEWEMVAYGTGDENGGNWYAIQGEIPLTDQANARIEELISGQHQ